MTGHIRIPAALTLTAAALILAPLDTTAAPVRGHHDLKRPALVQPAPPRPGFVHGGSGTRSSPHAGENGYLGLNDMLTDPKGRPAGNPRGKFWPNSPSTVLPVPLPATLPLLLGGIALIGAVRHRRT